MTRDKKLDAQMNLPLCQTPSIDLPADKGNARSSVESNDSLVIHSTTPFSVWQPPT